MSRREVIRQALEEDWGVGEEVPSPGSTWAAREEPVRPEPVAIAPTTDLQALIDEYARRRKEGHQAGCLCQSRDQFMGCVELRRLIARAGEWQILYA